MDVLAFLKDRTTFIRGFYETASAPFSETIRKIEEGEAPFDDPPYTEDGEPPFLAEWLEADEGLNVLGRACISMLSSSLQLYFKTSESELGVKWEKGEGERAFKNGFVRGYKTCFGEVLGLSWDDCPADFEVLEQIVLARNRDQHPETITTMRVAHLYKERKERGRLIFVSETERKMYEDPGMADIAWLNPAVHVSREELLKAVEEVERLAEWLEERMLAVRYRS